MFLFKRKRSSDAALKSFVMPDYYYSDCYQDPELKTLLNMLFATIQKEGVTLSNGLQVALGKSSAKILAFYQNLSHPIIDAFSKQGGMARFAAMKSGRVALFYQALFERFGISESNAKARYLVCLFLVALLGDIHLVAQSYSLYAFKKIHKNAPSQHVEINVLSGHESQIGNFPRIGQEYFLRVEPKRMLTQLPIARVHLLYQAVLPEVLDFLLEDDLSLLSQLHGFLGGTTHKNVFSEFDALVSQNVINQIDHFDSLKDKRGNAYVKGDRGVVDDLQERITEATQKREDEVRRSLSAGVSDMPECATHTEDEVCELEMTSDAKANNLNDGEVASVDEFLEYLAVAGEGATEKIEKIADFKSDGIKNDLNDWIKKEIGRCAVNHEDGNIFADLSGDHDGVLFVLNEFITHFAQKYQINKADITPTLVKAGLLYKPQCQFEINRAFSYEKVTAVYSDLGADVSTPMPYSLHENSHE